MVSASARQVEDPGSIPGAGMVSYFSTLYRFVIVGWVAHTNGGAGSSSPAGFMLALLAKH